MLSEDQGIKAIIALQAMAGINESEEDAKIGWDKMSEFEKKTTEKVYKGFYGGFKEKEEV